MTTPWHLFLMAAMYVVAGFFHFYKPKPYLAIMPPYLPQPKALVFWSGVAEILLGLGLIFTPTRVLSIYFIVAMLIVFLPVHIYMLQSEQAAKGVPKWFLWLRLPLQFVLIWWAVFYLP
ncbi:DoxX family protein [Aquimarina agarivorans]|uniref:DoxX family protein n=1 Tax=Aquimarina agarivorans TaxID=980584 RepID=UPI0002F3E284|nr:hypothetical protein [Aquimarina agarivorans]